MSFNPLNLAFRFVVEITILVGFAAWGWRGHEGAMRVILGLGLPLLAAALWGVFRVPGDPGRAPVAVPGFIRLALELLLFSLAFWVFNDLGYRTFSWIFGLSTALHYMLSYDRIRWLITM